MGTFYNRLLLVIKSEKQVIRVILAFAFVACITLSPKLFATGVSNQTDTCVDVLLVFARGSGQNHNQLHVNEPFGDLFKREENMSGEFFHRVRYLLDQYYPNVTYKAHSVHNFPDKYHPLGYRAVSVGFGGTASLLNSLQAEFSWAPLGGYKDSVNNGVEEVIGFVRDELGRCPDQRIVLGGYSQGAQVIGESLFQLAAAEQDRIGAVALFGDPKYVGADGNPWNPLAKFEPYPWKRGTATNRDRGLADARIPYVPSGMEYKVLSWCFRDDFVCSGYSGIRSLRLSEAGAGHVRYNSSAAPQAASEAVQRIAPELYALNKKRGGLDKDAGPVQPVPNKPVATPIDFMFLVNTSAGADSLLATLRANTGDVIPPISGFFSNVRYGVGDFNENSFYTSTGFLTRAHLRQDLKPYGLGWGNLTWTFYRNLAHGGLSGGGGDVPDPHTLALERMTTRPSWRPEATKHLVLITNRPAKDPHTYDICDGAFRGNSGISNPNVCYGPLPAIDQQSSRLYPDLCDTIRQALTQDVCTLEHKGPGFQHKITRTLDDAITAARAKGISISVVIPSPTKQSPTSIDYVSQAKINEQLGRLTSSTGGIFLEYDNFHRDSYSDMIWQVLNHTPKQLQLAHHDSVEALGAGESLQPKDKVLGRVDVPTVLDVSGSSATYASYKWDFDGDGRWDETTVAPNTEHIFSEPADNGFLKVAALNESGETEAELTLPLTVLPYDGPTFADVLVPELPENIRAVRDANENLTLSWQNGRPGEVFVVGDPETGMPVHSAPADQNGLSFVLSADITSLKVWILGETASSPRSDVLIKHQVTAPDEQTDKMGLGESAPWLQFLQNPAVVSQTQLARSSNQPPANLPVVRAAAATFTNAGTEPQIASPVQPNKQPRVLAQTNRIEPEPANNNSAPRNHYLFILLVTATGLIVILMYRKLSPKA